VRGSLERALDTLSRHYPERKSFLDYENPFQLLVAVVLSAQCTDACVNEVTPALFSAYPDPTALSTASPTDLETLVFRTGFYRTKARHIREAAAIIVERFGGKVPGTMEELTSLPGVGRKSAGVILTRCYGGEAIIVDTHFARVAWRLGLTAKEKNGLAPARVERDVAALLPKGRWTECSDLLNRHGRETCFARKPRCFSCPISAECDSFPVPGAV
jgi:endonuclease III